MPRPIRLPLRWDRCSKMVDHPPHEGGDGTWNCIGRRDGFWNSGIPAAGPAPEEPAPEVTERWLSREAIGGGNGTVIGFTADDDPVHVHVPVDQYRTMLGQLGYVNMDATEEWVRLDGAGHLERLHLVPDPESTITIPYHRYRNLLAASGWQQVVNMNGESPS